MTRVLSVPRWANEVDEVVPTVTSGGLLASGLKHFRSSSFGIVSSMWRGGRGSAVAIKSSTDRRDSAVNGRRP